MMKSVPMQPMRKSLRSGNSGSTFRLIGQFILCALAGYAFVRFDFAGRELIFVAVGLSLFGAPESGINISTVSVATVMVIAPLMIAFLIFQRQFVQAFLRVSIL